jgi:hypothetical protein
MAARTIGESGRGDAFGAADSLPTFSTPQFSPVAPVLLPMTSSGPPKWVYPVLAVLAIGMLALGVGIYKVISVPPPAPPASPQIVMPAQALPAPAPAAAASPGAPTPAEPAKAVATEERPGEDKGVTEKRKTSGKSGKAVAKGPTEATPFAKTTPEPAVTTPAPAPRPKKGGSIDDLLNQVGTSKGGGEEPKPKKVATAAALPALSQSDIVSAMKAVQPRVKECYNQYKIPGIANVSISVSKGGRIASASVTGKFAGTPSGTCVEAAAKTAKFPPCEAMSFPWPFQLH